MDIVERMQSWRVGKLAGRDELIVDDLQSGAAEIYRLRIELQGEQVAFDLLEREVERLRGRVRELVSALDDKIGTPCEQIRHQQEVERLRDAAVIAKTTEANLHEEIERLREQAERDCAAINSTYLVQRDLKAEIERLREANVRLQEALAADPMDQSAEIERLRSVVKVLRRAGGNDNACCS